MADGTGHNGNGNGYTTKEMLARIDAKLDALSASVETVRLDLAVHEVRPFHAGAVKEFDEVRTEVRAHAMRFAAIGGVLTLAAFLIGIAVRVL